MMPEKSSSIPEEIEVYRQLDEYPWDQDKDFQAGLSAILGPHPKPSQTFDLTLRARCFYYSRKNSVPISFDGYKSHLLRLENQHNGSNVSEQSSSSRFLKQTFENHQTESSYGSISDKSAPYPPSFTEIIELIVKNAPIPGIRNIPPTTVPEQASVSTIPKRKKPWNRELSDRKVNIGEFED